MSSPQRGLWIYRQVAICIHLYVYRNCPHVTNPNVAMQSWPLAKTCNNNNWDILLISCLSNIWAEIKLKCHLVNAISVTKGLKSRQYSEEVLLKELVMGYGSMLSSICGHKSRCNY